MHNGYADSLSWIAKEANHSGVTWTIGSPQDHLWAPVLMVLNHPLFRVLVVTKGCNKIWTFDELFVNHHKIVKWVMPIKINLLLIINIGQPEPCGPYTTSFNGANFRGGPHGWGSEGLKWTGFLWCDPWILKSVPHTSKPQNKLILDSWSQG